MLLFLAFNAFVVGICTEMLGPARFCSAYTLKKHHAMLLVFFLDAYSQTIEGGAR